VRICLDYGDDDTVLYVCSPAAIVGDAAAVNIKVDQHLSRAAEQTQHQLQHSHENGQQGQRLSQNTV
jgi:hypothetical protein